MKVQTRAVTRTHENTGGPLQACKHCDGLNLEGSLVLAHRAAKTRSAKCLAISKC